MVLDSAAGDQAQAEEERRNGVRPVLSVDRGTAAGTLPTALLPLISCFVGTSSPPTLSPSNTPPPLTAVTTQRRLAEEEMCGGESSQTAGH